MVPTKTSCLFTRTADLPPLWLGCSLFDVGHQVHGCQERWASLRTFATAHSLSPTAARSQTRDAFDPPPPPLPGAGSWERRLLFCCCFFFEPPRKNSRQSSRAEITIANQKNHINWDLFVDAQVICSRLPGASPSQLSNGKAFPLSPELGLGENLGGKPEEGSSSEWG